ncbi:bucentaur or craniofacial development-domain-containing protein [Xylogone sp. PMI_703]|nr:bucentaur or craniofacial development-domain-containing protein [Xylogone sp. PMI_703]
MSPEPILDDDNYASEEDSDFAPEDAPAQASEESSDSEEDEPDASGVKQSDKAVKRKRSEDEAEDVGFENSGDEAIIDKARKSRKKKDKGDDPEDGGEGGLIKTRSMRAQEKAEKKPLVDTTTATVDVDALWESMISGKLPNVTTTNASHTTKDAVVTEDEGPKAPIEDTPMAENGEKLTPIDGDDPDAMIVIKRTYKFAGEVHTEEKLVPKNSAEAKLYLSSKTDTEPVVDKLSPFAKPKRPIKKLQRSRFEPAMEHLPQRTDLYFGKRAVNNDGAPGAKVTPAKKLNTVEKSAMDWAGFVDKEGIKDELEAASKAKGAYKARQEFLARVEQKKDEEARRARVM